MEDKSLAKKSIPITRNLKELHLFFGSTNQFINFVLNLASYGGHLRRFLYKKLTFNCSGEHTIAFEKNKSENVKLIENTHFDMKLKTRVKPDASHSGLGAMLEQLDLKD